MSESSLTAENTETALRITDSSIYLSVASAFSAPLRCSVLESNETWMKKP
jgi:hypothetical protein